MAFLTDSLRAAIEACGRFNPFGRGAATALPTIFTHQLAIAAYTSSGMLRKVIAIPAEDRVREWRDWQADKDTIAKIEAEERRLGMVAKTKEAETLRGIGGGALILITAGDHAKPLRPETIAEGGLIAINVVSRWQIQGLDWDRDLASPTYGSPGMFQVSGNGQQQKIHPSRVICFRGQPLPAGAAVADEEAFWGDSRLLRVFDEVQRSDQTQAWFAALVKKAKLLRIGIPNLSDYTATNEGQAKLASRVALIAEGENSLNATVFAAAAGTDQAGETITDYQITWAGIPAVMDAFDQRVAAVSDIPFTRLMGRSPAGMNATGKSDQDNWNKMVVAGQKLELRPCLEQLDPFLLRSAGVAKPEDVTWRFAPLDVPSEREQADTFKVEMEAIEKLQNTGAIPEVAFAKGVQNLMAEREYLPGLDQALAEVPEDERFGLNLDPDDDDPSAITQSGNGVEGGDPTSAGGGAVPRSARRAANDKVEVGEDADLPFLDAKRRSKAQRLAGRAAANHFDPTQPRGRDGRWIPAGRRQFIDAARAGRPEGHQLIVGKVSARAADRMGSIGLNGADKSVALDASNLRHIHKRHGNETRSGHLSVGGEDMASAASILNGARVMRRLSPAPTGAPRFATMTSSRGQRVYAVYEVRRHAVALHTMWVRG